MQKRNVQIEKEKIYRYINIFKNSKNLKNSYWIIGAQIFQMILSFIVGAISARYLGPENYGTLNYTASFVAFFSTIVTLGMDSVVISKIIKYPVDEGKYIGSAIVYRIVCALFSSISIAGIIIILNPWDKIKLILALLQSMQLFFLAIEIVDAWFQKNLLSRYTSVARIVASIIISSYKVIILITRRGLVFFAITNVLTDLILAVVLLFLYSKLSDHKLSYSSSYGRDILKESYHFVLVDILSSLYIYMDRIMLGKMMSDKIVGIYTAATTISTLWIFVPNAIITSFRPTIMALKSEGKEKEYKRRLEQLFSVIELICFFFSICVCWGAKIIVYVLYGMEYMEAIVPLRIIIWAKFFAVISVTRGIWIICENKNRYVKNYVVIGSVTNLILNFCLIPLWGINGAAIATFFTELSVGIIAPCFFRETRESTLIIMRSLCGKWYWEKDS